VAAGDELLEVFLGAGVDGVGVRVGVVGELEVGTGHAEHAQGVAFDENAAFGGVDHIVRDGGDLTGEFGQGAEGAIGTDSHRRRGTEQRGRAMASGGAGVL